MNKLAALRSAFEWLLEAITIFLMVSLAVVVIVGVIYRTAGVALVWYDEVASVQLAWLTYYGSALAALKRAHIGVPGLVNALRPNLRVPLVIVSRAIVIGFFVLLAWLGYEVLVVLEGDTLISLPDVSTQITQSVIPIGAVLFIIAELVNLPLLLREARAPLGAPDQA
ncbi:MAG: TRAP transporter small permease subunit [Alphaproteobacteria bacterium]